MTVLCFDVFTNWGRLVNTMVIIFVYSLLQVLIEQVIFFLLIFVNLINLMALTWVTKSLIEQVIRFVLQHIDFYFSSEKVTKGKQKNYKKIASFKHSFKAQVFIFLVSFSLSNDRKTLPANKCW